MPWHGVVYCNPPYSGAAAFLRRAHAMWAEGACPTIVLLLPCQTHLAVFHDLVVGNADVLFLRDRLSFISPDGRRDRAPFPSMLVCFGACRGTIARLMTEFACVHLSRDAASSTGNVVRRRQPAKPQGVPT